MSPTAKGGAIWSMAKDRRWFSCTASPTSPSVLAPAAINDVAPMVGEWIHQATLAIRAEIPLEVLLDEVAQFPTYRLTHRLAWRTVVALYPLGTSSLDQRTW